MLFPGMMHMKSRLGEMTSILFIHFCTLETLREWWILLDDISFDLQVTAVLLRPLFMGQKVPLNLNARINHIEIGIANQICGSLNPISCHTGMQ